MNLNTPSKVCVLLLLFIVGYSSLHATHPSGFPTAVEVITTIKGQDQLHTYTMQIGALERLRRILTDGGQLAAETRRLPDGGQAILTEYRETIVLLRNNYDANVSDIDDEAAKKEWVHLCNQYMDDPKIQSEVVALMSPKLRKKFNQIDAKWTAEAEKRAKVNEAELARFEREEAFREQQGKLREEETYFGIYLPQKLRVGIVGFIIGLFAFGLGFYWMIRPPRWVTSRGWAVTIMSGVFIPMMLFGLLVMFVTGADILDTL